MDATRLQGLAWRRRCNSRMSCSPVHLRRRLVALAVLAAAVLTAVAAASGASQSVAAPHRANAQRPGDGASPATAAIPRAYLAAYRAAGARFGLSWRLLAAVGANESRHGRSAAPGVHAGLNAAGCCAGPAQLCVVDSCGATWQAYAMDGDGDGRVSVYDPDDAVFTAARYLRALRRDVGSSPDRLLAAYNAGAAGVLAHGGAPPYPQTQRYVAAGARVMRAL